MTEDTQTDMTEMLRRAESCVGQPPEVVAHIFCSVTLLHSICGHMKCDSCLNRCISGTRPVAYCAIKEISHAINQCTKHSGDTLLMALLVQQFVSTLKETINAALVR